MAERLIVIGGDAAGLSAAFQARRRRHNLDIVVFERGNWTSYSACGIPYVVAGDVASLDDLVVRRPSRAPRAQHIDVRMRHEVVGIDLDTRRVTSATTTTIATCSSLRPAPGRPAAPAPRAPDLPGIDGDARLRRADARRRRGPPGAGRGVPLPNVVVVGGGYIGLEMAEAFLRWGAEVDVVEGGDQVMGTLDPDMAGRIAHRRSSATASTSAPVCGSRASSPAGSSPPTARCRPTSSCSASA